MTERIHAAYADERLVVPVEEIERRAGRRHRRWLPMAAAVATAAAAVVALVVVQGATQRPGPVATSTDPCQQLFEMLGGRGLVPQTRLLLRDGDDWVRVYPNGEMISTCRGTGQRAVQTHGTRMDDPAGTLSLFGGRESVLKGGGVLLGRVPPGATRIEARLASGRRVEGKVDADLFAVFAPGDSFAGARLTAYDSGGGLVADVTAPSESYETFDGGAFARMCEERGLGMLRDRPGLPQTMPPLRFRLPGEGGDTVWVYAGDHAILTCRWMADGGYGVTGYAFTARPTSDGFQTMVLAAGERDGWVVGRALAGTQRVDVVLSDKRVVPAELAGAFFAARWTGEVGTGTPVQPSRIAVHLPGKTYTEEFGQPTSPPR